VARGIELDWVLIRVNTIRKIAAIAATGVLAAILVVLAYWRLNPAPDVAARRAIERAQVAHEEVLKQPLPEIWRGELEQAEDQLEAARVAYSNESWPLALSEASGARSRFEALAGARSHELIGVGQFFSLEGRVSVQRAGKPEWIGAHPRMPVFNGDFVKTARDGSAEILFADGSLYRIAPNSLLEIHRQIDADRDSGSVKMVVGRINVSTSDSSTTVTTDSTETEVERDSRVAVDVTEEDRSTKVAVSSGGARVRNPRGQEVVLASREQVAAEADGRLSEKARLPRAPVPVEPQNNVGFNIETEPIIDLRWRMPAETKVAHLQVSRSKRFLDDLMDVDAPALEGERARLKAINPGTYYWRVASVAGDRLRSEWSSVRRFQIFSEGRSLIFDDRTPPELNVREIQQLGHLFIVEGDTEVGATVTINGEHVEVDASGRFRKTVEATRSGMNEIRIVAVDPAGNETPLTQQVVVEVY
jgi:hypothetical protein